MPRYISERTFPHGLNSPVAEGGAQKLLGVVSKNSDLGVTWVHCPVSDDMQRTFCVYGLLRENVR